MIMEAHISEEAKHTTKSLYQLYFTNIEVTYTCNVSAMKYKN